MRRLRSTCSELAAAAALLCGSERAALAQACCVAPNAWGLGRLAPYESALAGVQARAQTSYGAFDADGSMRPNPAGVRDVELEQDVFATARVLGRGELSVVVPWLETMRSAEAISDWGGGLGDISLNARWAFGYGQDEGTTPGVSLLAGAVLPTGRAPEQAGDPLGAGATGTGAAQFFGGLELEQLWGPWLAASWGTAAFRAPRQVGLLASQLAPRFTFGALGGHAWKSGTALSLAVSYGAEGDASVAGQTVPASGARSLSVASALQVRLLDHTRLVMSAFGSPPLAGLNANGPADVGCSASLVRGWD